MAGLNLGQMISHLNTVAGLDLDTSEATLLLNEGYRELTVRSEFMRSAVSFGTTVAGQEAYTIPTNVSRIRELRVNGQPYSRISEEDGFAVKAGDLRFVRDGIYHGLFWPSFPAGVPSISIYPTPTESGQAIDAHCVLIPTDLVDNADEPVIPAEYRRGIIDYAAAQAFGSIEDNAELRVFYEGEFENKVQALGLLGVSRFGRGPVQMQVEGYHF